MAILYMLGNEPEIERNDLTEGGNSSVRPSAAVVVADLSALNQPSPAHSLIS